MDILRKFETTSSFDAHSNECKKHLSLQLCGIQNQQSQKVQKLVITLQAAVATPPKAIMPYPIAAMPSESAEYAPVAIVSIERFSNLSLLSRIGA